MFDNREWKAALASSCAANGYRRFTVISVPAACPVALLPVSSNSKLQDSGLASSPFSQSSTSTLIEKLSFVVFDLIENSLPNLNSARFIPTPNSPTVPGVTGAFAGRPNRKAFFCA
ncbi:protein of unknown function [Cupriavidus taiwanensis]|nr:protein of unknown function [Cupriavidus taiwanensis]